MNSSLTPPAPQPSRKAQAAQARRAALIEHTRALMLQRGPHHVSLAEVLRLAGGSKATVAKYFGDRNGLIAAAIAQEANEAMASLIPLNSPPFQTPDPVEPLAKSLAGLLAGVLTFYLQPASLAVYRGIIASSGQDAGLATAFYNSGHTAVITSMASFLDHLKQRGLRRDLDTTEAAEQLAHALRSGLYEQVLLGILPLPADEAAIRAKAQAVSRHFLDTALSSKSD